MSAFGCEAYLSIVASNAVFLFTMFFSYVFAELKSLFFEKNYMKVGSHFKHYCCHLIVESFIEQMNLKNKILLFVVQTYRRKKEVPYTVISRDNDQKGKGSPNKEKSCDNDQKRYVYT